MYKKDIKKLTYDNNKNEILYSKKCRKLFRYLFKDICIYDLNEHILKYIGFNSIKINEYNLSFVSLYTSIDYKLYNKVIKHNINNINKYNNI